MPKPKGFSSPSRRGRRPRYEPPKMRRHAGSKRARTRIDGKTIWLGRWDGKDPSPEAIQKFEEVIAEWLRQRHGPTPAAPLETQPASSANEAAAATPSEPPIIGVAPADRRLTVAELVAAYCDFAEAYYMKSDGSQTSSIYLVKRACVALNPFMETYADAFGPLKFTTLIEGMAKSQTLTRKTINDIAKCIRRVFRFGANRQLIPGTVYHSLQSVELLKRNRSLAKDNDPVQPVSDEVIEKTIQFLSPTIRDMVRLQRATGARPGEICNLKAGDIDTSGDVWVATLRDHKTAYAGCPRELLFGPDAQAILRRYLPRESTEAVFDPREVEQERQRERRKSRKTKLYPSHVRRLRAKRKAKPKRSAGPSYTDGAYRRAIHRACERAGVEKWSPNQIRHTAATEFKNRYGWEVARVILGHRAVNTTAIYAERDRDGAVMAIREVG
jgi:integrase